MQTNIKIATMKIKYIIILPALAFCLLSSCEQPDASVGSYEPMVIFNEYTLNNAAIRRSSSFVYSEESVLTDTVWIPVRPMGSLPDRDLYIKFEQFEETRWDLIYDEKGNVVDSTLYHYPNQAEPGVHYVPFDDPEYSKLLKLEAGDLSRLVPVVTKRHSSLKTETYYLNFRIVDSGDLKVGGYKLQSVKISIADHLSQPALWDQWFFAGTYSIVKHQFMIDVTGHRWDDGFIESLDDGQKDYYRYILRQELANENARRAEQGLEPLRSAPDDPYNPNVEISF